MKINIILPEFGLSGGVMVALRYARALTEFGHDVMCYGKKLPYCKPKDVKDVAHAVHRLISNYDVEIALEQCGKFIYQVPLFINNKTIRNADIVIATAWCTAFDVEKLAKSKGKKYYFIQDYEIWDNKERGIQSYKLPLNHIAIAKWIDDILVKEYACKPAVIVHNGVDLELFRPRAEARNNEITISMMYHLLAKKGISDGLKVLDEIHMIYPEIRMIMFGKQQFIEKPDYIEYVRDPNPQQLVEIYQQSDIFLFPAREEGWGLTVIEAMACGCVVVGTRTGALIEIGVDEENALISEPGRPKLLKNNVIRLIQDKKLRKTIEKGALETAQGLSWDKACKKFEKALIN